MKQLLLSFLMIAGLSTFMSAQTLEELKSMKSDKEAALGALADEVAALEKQIYEFPGWKYGGVGVAGFNLLANNDWYALATPNSSNQALSLGLGAFANLDVEKYFWRNLLSVNVNLSQAKSDKGIANTSPEDPENRTVALVNGLDLTSLFGYKLSEKIAISAEGKYISSVLAAKQTGNQIDGFELAFNKPGQLTVSAGITWTPINNLVVLIHPLGWQKNWPGDLISTPGAKIGASYAAEIIPGIAWTSNLSAFIPYTNGDGDVEYKDDNDNILRTVLYDSPGDLVNWTWINGFSTSIFKGLGVAFNLGLRGDRQIADLGRIRSAVDPNTENISDNPLQSFYTLGLGYTF